MASPTPTDRTVTLIATDTTAHTIDLPSVVSGDGLLIVGSIDGGVTVTDWDGFTELDVASNGTDVTLAIGYLKATGSEGSTKDLVVSAAQKGSWKVYKFAAADVDFVTDTPEVGTAVPGDSTSPDPPNLAPSWGSADTWWLAAEGHDSNSVSTGFPSSYTDTESTPASGGSGSTVLSTAERELEASSENPGAFTMSTEQWVANTISVVSPAGGGGNGGGDGVAFDDDITLIIEMGFGDGVYDDPSWTDITAYVRDFSTQRGRDFSGDPVAPGTGQMTLDNTDGRFDPTYTSGAYYPGILPMVQVRIRAHYAIDGALELDHGSHGQVGDPLQSGTIDVWRGYASSWPQTWPGNFDATVPVEMVDATKLLNLNFASSGQGHVHLLGIETVGKRLHHLLDAGDWPKAWRHIPTGAIDGYVVPAKNNNGTILSGMRELAEYEQGTILVQPNGNIALIPYGYQDTWVAQVTFGDDPGEAPYTDLKLAFDDDQIWNRADIGSPNLPGQPVVVNDTTSQDLFGNRNQRVPTLAGAAGNENFPDTVMANAQALRIIDTWKDPNVRVEQITFQPQKDPTSLWPAALGLDVGAKITVKRRPPAGNTITVDCYIDGVTHQVEAGGVWETTFLLSQNG